MVEKAYGSLYGWFLAPRFAYHTLEPVFYITKIFLYEIWIVYKL